MKKTILILLGFLPLLVTSQSAFDPATLVSIAEKEQIAFERRQTAEFPVNTGNYDVKWYRCCWNIDPAVDSISGNITTLFTPLGSALDSLILDLNRVLTVDSVLYHGFHVSWYPASDQFIIRFPSSIPQNVPDSVTVFYHGVPPANGFGSFVQDEHNGAPIIWTLSEPYGASDWWPCKNGLSDKADSLDIFIRTPASSRSASNGVLVSSQTTGNTITWHWKHRYPVATYLVCLAVTNYARYTEPVYFGADTLNFVNYVYPEDSAFAASRTGVTASMIQLYDSLFGIYPFQREKYGHAQFGAGGGMEHQTMTFVTSFDFELIAHELAHQWFGDKITCGSWPDIWLNEGFATYLSGLCYEHLLPSFWTRFREVRIHSIVSQPDGSVYCTDTSNIPRLFNNRLTYAKGAMILHQLRWLIGDSAFFAALKNYITDPALVYGFVHTADLKAHLESSSGQDLTWYFNDWFTGQGYPTYQLSWVQQGDTVSFSLGQTQSHPSVTFFKMSVPILFKNNQRDTLIRFFNTFSGQSFTAVVPFKADSVIFDPDYQLIAGNHLVNAVNEHSGSPRLLLFPNPASDRLTLRFGELCRSTEGKIIIYSADGRKIDEWIVQQGKTEFILDTRSYPSGFYFFNFRGSGFRERGKFIIQR